jgi:hypothetical protein
MFRIEVYYGGKYSYTYRASTRALAIKFVQMYNRGNTKSKAVHAW